MAEGIQAPPETPMTTRPAARRVCRPSPEVARTKLPRQRSQGSCFESYSHDGVHDRLEEVGHDQADHAAHAGDGTDEHNHDASHGAVNGEQERSRDEGKQGSSDLYRESTASLAGVEEAKTLTNRATVKVMRA